jgi:hypothetical protein
MTAPLLTPREWSDMWQALKDHLARECRAHEEIASSCAGVKDLAATRWEQRGIVQGLKRAQDKMTELDAQR